MYSKILKDEMELDDIYDLCVSIDCKDIMYPFCFIRKETRDYLVVDSTRDDGTEGLVIIPKSKVLSVSVVYQQDFDALFEDDNQDKRLYQ